MRDPHQDEQLPDTVTASAIHEKIKHTQYMRLEGTTTTVCQLTLENGYTIIGTSACVDPAKYNQALGEKYAYEDAFNKIWPLEGYLLRQRHFERGIQ